jgi:hypothetical protein
MTRIEAIMIANNIQNPVNFVDTLIELGVLNVDDPNMRRKELIIKACNYIGLIDYSPDNPKKLIAKMSQLIDELSNELKKEIK